jgi:thiol-disulfide isomerase/thioredoxin
MRAVFLSVLVYATKVADMHGLELKIPQSNYGAIPEIDGVSSPTSPTTVRSTDGVTGMAGSFPNFATSVGRAADRRGQIVPALSVDEWITSRFDAPTDKLLVLNFWATWCAPCRPSIPYINEIATTNADIALCVGISDESHKDFEIGLNKAKLKLDDFKYSLALDPEARLKRYFEIRTIPHCVVVSSDRIVRWQGHPVQLTREVFQQLADAQRALNAAPQTAASSR